MKIFLAILLVLCPGVVFAGAQQYEPLAAAVQTALHYAVSDSDRSPPTQAIDSQDFRRWLTSMSTRLRKRMPDETARTEFLTAVYYESVRAGLDPQLVLGVIHVESAFRKYAVSGASARGYMQVMPFWVQSIGRKGHDLFHLRTNLRYGCTILRHYLDIERGNVFRALGRYNGSLGKPAYPTIVTKARDNFWKFTDADVARAADPVRVSLN
jgi:soluble lytic murein transglycosylase-like protein